MMMDFFNNNARDPIQFVNHSNSYIEFLNMVEDDFQIDILLRIKDEIDNLDLDTITPLEALNILHKLKSYN